MRPTPKVKQTLSIKYNAGESQNLNLNHTKTIMTKNNMILAQKKTCSPIGQVEDTKINPECYIHLIIYESAKKHMKYIAEKTNPAY